MSIDPVRVVQPCGFPKKRDGSPCQSIGLSADGLCAQHSTSFTDEQRSSWGFRGAAAANYTKLIKKETVLAVKAAQGLPAAAGVPDLSSTTACEVFLAETIAHVQNGTMPPSVARVVGELIQVRLKLVELSQAERLLQMEEEAE